MGCLGIRSWVLGIRNWVLGVRNWVLGIRYGECFSYEATFLRCNLTCMKQLSYRELKQWNENGKAYQLIDVREKEEHHHLNIGGTLIPLDEILKRAALIDVHVPVVFYCKRGIRSQLAIQKLQRKGIRGDFYNLTNGIWHLLHSQ